MASTPAAALGVFLVRQMAGRGAACKVRLASAKAKIFDIASQKKLGRARQIGWRGWDCMLKARQKMLANPS
jgi:hypothetical protein